MTDLGESKAVPERWRDEYACILSGEIEDADVEKQLMEELGTAEAKVRELETQLLARDGYIRFIREECHRLQAIAGCVGRDEPGDAIALVGACIAQQAATTERLTKALEAVEWVDMDGEKTCPFCFTFESFGRHQVGCLWRKCMADRRAASQKGESQ